MSALRSPVRWFALLSVLLGACARVGPQVEATPRATLVPAAIDVRPGTPLAADVVPLSDEVRQAVTVRVAELKSSGGFCETYGAVLERSLATGRIVLRPYMWRVGPNLASAQAHSTGEIAVARDVDPLNVGLRSLDEILHSVEHEAAHIAFAIPSGASWNEAVVDERVSQCRGNGHGGAQGNSAKWGAREGK